MVLIKVFVSQYILLFKVERTLLLVLRTFHNGARSRADNDFLWSATEILKTS